MTEFDEIKSYLSQKIDKLDQFIQIEEREEFLIIDYNGQSFIIIDILVNSTCTIHLNDEDILINDFDDTKTFNPHSAP